MNKKKAFQEFHVEPVIGGFIGYIGCRKIVFPTLIDVARALTEYWENPEAAVKRWQSMDYGNDPIPQPGAPTELNSAIDKTLG